MYQPFDSYEAQYDLETDSRRPGIGTFTTECLHADFTQSSSFSLLKNRRGENLGWERVAGHLGGELDFGGLVLGGRH